MSYRVEPIPALKDNYVWCLYHTGNRRALVVDPGDAMAVQQFLRTNSLVLDTIFLTHHHPDHSAGIQTLLDQTEVPVFGPGSASPKGVSHPVSEGSQLRWQDLTFDVIEVPGHTLDHIAFNCVDPALEQPVSFCGDTLFVCGCGRIFEGTAAQMRHSLAKLCELPDDTLMCGGHEYTLANLAFARSVRPEDPQLREFEDQCKQTRAAGKPTLPTTLAREKRLNPFLQWDNGAIAQAALDYGEKAGLSVSPDNPDEVFAAIRHWKDNF